MIKELCAKQGFVTFLLISFGIATLKLLSESSHFTKSPMLRKYSGNVSENKSEIKHHNDISDLKSNVVKETIRNSKTVPQKPGNILSICGYNVCFKSIFYYFLFPKKLVFILEYLNIKIHLLLQRYNRASQR